MDATFTQQPPALSNTWVADSAIQRTAKRLLASDTMNAVDGQLHDAGARAAGQWLDWHYALDTRTAEPVHTPWDAWGNRIDAVETNPAWRSLKAAAHDAGVVAAGHESTHGPDNRLHQFLITYLFAPSSGLVSCPMAMTDGAATALKAHPPTKTSDATIERLVSRDPGTAWTSGQWMTERSGGSDVGLTTTTATDNGDGTWSLSGVKWFTSAIDADVTLTLARPVGNPAGGRGLAMFLARVRNDDGELNNLRVLRLKDKLGTRQVPTAELELDGTVATRIGEATGGTKAITPMLAITRLWNSVVAAAGMGRALQLSRAYAHERQAFGKALIDHPLHASTLADMRADHEISVQLAMQCARLLGDAEAGDARASELLRLLLPATKAFTGKLAVRVASEALECFGGAGYIEDTHLPHLLRDAQVLPIWEGTTNVLSLDVLRALAKSKSGLSPLQSWLSESTQTLTGQNATIAAQAHKTIDEVADFLKAHADAPTIIQHRARDILMQIAGGAGTSLLAVQADHDDAANGDKATTWITNRVAARHLPAERQLGAGPSAQQDLALARGSGA